MGHALQYALPRIALAPATLIEFDLATVIDLWLSTFIALDLAPSTFVCRSFNVHRACSFNFHRSPSFNFHRPRSVDSNTDNITTTHSPDTASTQGCRFSGFPSLYRVFVKCARALLQVRKF